MPLYQKTEKIREKSNMTTALEHFEKTATPSRKPKVTSVSVPCAGLAKRDNGGRWGVGCKRELKSGDFFVTTHRARSKGYASLSKIPVARIRFVDSTG